VDLNPVKASQFGILCAFTVLSNNLGDLVQFKSTRRLEGHLPKVCGQRFATIVGHNRRRRNWQAVLWMEGTMGDASDVPKLKKDISTFGVDRARSQLPAFDLLR
jgi:hypothetical protein